MKTRFRDYIKNNDFTNWLNSQPNQGEIFDLLQIEGKQISPTVYDFYGDKLSGIKIDVNDLEGYGTKCGRINNECFDEDVVIFLRECGIDYIISSVFLNEPTQLGHCLIEFEDFGDAGTFSEMIEDRNGSLTPDGKINNFFFFENE